MKLEKLIISNFRGLKGSNNVIEFKNVNIIFLIGQNNVGKSSYLRAYEFFVNPKQVAGQEDFYDHKSDNNIIIEGWFLKEPDDNDAEDFAGRGRNADPEWINKWVTADSHIKVRKTWRSIGGAFQKETYSPQHNNWVENGFGGMDTLFSKYAPTPIAINAMETEDTLEEKVNKLIQDDFIKKVRENHSELCDSIIQKIKDLQDKITSSDEVESFNAEINKHFKEVFADLSLKIHSSKDENIKLEDAFKKNHTITINNDRTDRREAFWQNGHGVIRQALFNFIAFLKSKSLNSNRKEYLILFEEPELFLHPKVAFKLRESLYKLAENSPYQIVCATHSPLMIDISKPHSSLIRLAKSSAEETYSHQVGQEVFTATEEKKQRVQMINRFNPHVCESFYADKVILVEGDTEAIVYRELLQKFYPDMEIFVVNTGSKNNIPFFQEIFTAFRIEHYVVHDVDSRTTSTGGDNPAWTLNQKIWDFISKANAIEPTLARRYVHNTNFETAHGITLQGGKDKPLRAYEFAQTVSRQNTPDCLKWLDDIMGSKNVLHDMQYINSL